VSAVPLPVQVRRTSWAVPVGIAAAVCAAAVGLGVRELTVPPAPVLPSVAQQEPAGPILANMTALVAPAPPPAPEPVAAPADVTTTTMPAPPADQRLRTVDAQASFRDALEAVARAWRVEPPSDIERGVEDLPGFADRRQLEHLPLTGNVAMLRLLDVPAVLELRFPSLPDPRWVSLIRLTPDRATLAIDGELIDVELAFLERYWYGRAHVFARDFEGLGPGLLDDTRGLKVTRLQALLTRTGLYEGGETGVLGPTTRSAVMAFQRSRYLEPDGQVGRLTRMVLYAAVGGYDRPTLAGGAS
jgi:general secretion pathway protein A